MQVSSTATNCCDQVDQQGGKDLLDQVGQVVINERLLRGLIRLLANAPLSESALSARGVELQPHLDPAEDTVNPSAVPTRSVIEYLNAKGTEHWAERPRAPRVMGWWRRRQHPNAPYLFEAVDERDVLEDVQESYWRTELQVPQTTSVAAARRIYYNQKMPPRRQPTLLLPGRTRAPRENRR